MNIITNTANGFLFNIFTENDSNMEELMGWGDVIKSVGRSSCTSNVESFKEIFFKLYLFVRVDVDERKARKLVTPSEG